MEKRVLSVQQALDEGIEIGIVAEFSNNGKAWVSRKLTAIETEPIGQFVSEASADAVRNKVARWHFIRIPEPEVVPITLEVHPKYAGMMNVLNDITIERDKQNEKWGEQNHLPIEWMSILMEEVGEASKEVVEAYFNRQEGDLFNTQRTEAMLRFRAEMVQVAAVAVQMIECFDRNFVNNG